MVGGKQLPPAFLPGRIAILSHRFGELVDLTERASLYAIAPPCGEIAIDIGPGSQAVEREIGHRVVTRDDLGRRQETPIRSAAVTWPRFSAVPGACFKNRSSITLLDKLFFC